MSGITIVGLGPGDWDQTPAASRDAIATGVPVIVRTLRHPAAAKLAAESEVVSCDDLYESAPTIEAVYEAISDRVLTHADGGVVYAVPGGPLVGERSVAVIQERAKAVGIDVTVLVGGSFLEPTLAAAGVDPLERGVQVLDGHRLPDPLFLHLPTIIGHVDRATVLAGVKDELSRTLDGDVEVTVVRAAGTPAQVVEVVRLSKLHEAEVDPLTTLFLDPPPTGWSGLVAVNRRLRIECPWDREQTHHSLIQHLIEEAYEVVDAISALPAAAPEGEPDYAGYAELEEELGDLLLQVVFHATMAREAAGFDVEEVAEQVRRKLVRRHPHVFGGEDAPTPDEALGTWDRRKQEEKGRESVLDGVPTALPALLRAYRYQGKAASVGFDWPDVSGPLSKIVEEANELAAATSDEERDHELGDLLFSVVNLARHLRTDPELALRHAADRFADRFRAVEAMGPVDGLTLEELDARWDQAKQ